MAESICSTCKGYLSGVSVTSYSGKMCICNYQVMSPKIPGYSTIQLPKSSKYTITINCDDADELEAITKAVHNKRKLDELYDEVFRPAIKYGQNAEEVTAFEQVWEKVNEYLNED